MKKMVMVEDKKIVAYIVALCASFLASIAINFYLVLNQLISISDISFLWPIAILILLVGAFYLLLYYFMLKDCLLTVRIKDKDLRIGTLGFAYINYEMIEGIYFDTDINLKYEGKEKKIRVFDIGLNSDKYETLLSAIAENTDIGLEPKAALEQLKENQIIKYDTGGAPLRLGSWIMVMFVSLCMTLAGAFLSFMMVALISVISTFATETAITYPLWVFILIAFVIISALTALIVLMAKRMKAAVLLIKIYLCIFLLAGFAGIVTSLFSSMKYYSTWAIWFSLIPSLVYMISMSLLIFRYISISRRVKKTFIYDGFTKVAKADKSIDPPFKLFSKEPASLYALFSWIVFPLFMFITYFITLFAVLASAFTSGIFN